MNDSEFLEELVSLSNGMKSIYWKVETQIQICDAFSNMAEKDRALELLEDIETLTGELDDDRHVESLIKVADSLMTMGERQKAIDLLEKVKYLAGEIVDTHPRTEKTTQIANCFLKLGYGQEAGHFLYVAENEGRGIEDLYQKISCFLPIIEEWARLGEKHKVKQKLNWLIDESKELKEPWEIKEILKRIAYAWIKTGEMLKDPTFIIEGEILSKSIEDSSIRALVFCRIVEAWVMLGHKQLAKLMTKKAEQESRSITEKGKRAEALGLVSILQVKLGNVKMAERILKESETIAREIKDNTEQNAIIWAVVERWEEIFDITGDEKYLEHAEKIIIKVQDDEIRACVFGSLATRWAKEEEMDKVYQLLGEEEDIVRGMDNVYDRLGCHWLLVETLSKVAEATGEMEFLEKALSITREIKDDFFLGSMINAMAEVVGNT